jgi:translocation and assembly module TamA
MNPRALLAPAPLPCTAPARGLVDLPALHLPALNLPVLLVLFLLLWQLGGCASSGGLGSATGPEAAASEPAAAPVVKVEIDAPGKLKGLLARYLDLSRLALLTRGDAVTDTELTRLLDATPSQVRNLLQTEGYFRPTVQVQRAPAAQAGQAETVTVRVDPGVQARISRVTLEFEGPLELARIDGDRRAIDTVADLRANWPLPAGSEFRNADWSDAKATALSRLRSAGYAAASWSGTGAEVDREANAVRLFMVADSGPLFRSGPIKVEGLVRQEERTVQSLAVFSPGTPVTEALLLDYQELLQKAGLFESVTVSLDPNPDTAAAAPVLVRLRELPVQVFTVGVGISANDGPRASLEHVYRRVLGHPIAASNQLALGRVRRVWTGEISTHPSERFTRWLVGGAIERLVSDTDVVLSQRLRAGRSQDARQVEQLVFGEVERGVRTTDATDTSVFALSANYHVVLRRLDSVLLPTDGYSLSLQGSVGRSHGSASRSGIFTRAYGRLTAYHPLGRSWYGQARVELGQVFLPDGVAAPDSQLFRAGGDDSVRGYPYRSLGPEINGAVGSGPVLLTTSIEVARPIRDDMPSLWGALFVDAGRAGYSFGTLKPAIGYGAGLRWRSPVGPLRLDVAWGQDVRKLRLHFSVGIAF